MTEGWQAAVFLPAGRRSPGVCGMIAATTSWASWTRAPGSTGYSETRKAARGSGVSRFTVSCGSAARSSERATRAREYENRFGAARVRCMRWQSRVGDYPRCRPVPRPLPGCSRGVSGTRAARDAVTGYSAWVDRLAPPCAMVGLGGGAALHCTVYACYAVRRAAGGRRGAAQGRPR